MEAILDAHPIGEAPFASFLRMTRSASSGTTACAGARPESGDDALVLDPLAMGDLVHPDFWIARFAPWKPTAGLAAATAQKQIAGAVDRRCRPNSPELWESERAVPPRMIWRRTLDEAADLSKRALTFGEEALPGARAFSEVPFGGSEPKSDDSPALATSITARPLQRFPRHRLPDRRATSRSARHLR